MDYRRILLPGNIDDQCECKKGPSKCPSYCYALYPPDEYTVDPPDDYVVPPPPLSTVDHHSGLSTTHIIIIIVLCSLFVVLTCYAIVAQFCIGWRTRAPSNRQGRDEEEEEGGEVMEPPVNYVWYINTVGLEQSVINAITICKYKNGDGLIEGTECSVCLSEFRDDEDVRLLPKCSHAFHVNCIDTWLRSHVNCPLCRAHIVSDPAISSADNLQVPHDNPVGLPRENAQSVTSLDMDADGQNLEEELTSEAAREDGRMMDVNTLNGESSSGPRAISDLAGNHGQDELILEIGTGEELQPVRRSVSMDSSAASKIYSSLVVPRQAKRDGDNKKGNQATKGSSLLNRPVAMKRSYSSSGNFFPKRHNRNRRSVLPLRSQ